MTNPSDQSGGERATAEAGVDNDRADTRGDDDSTPDVATDQAANVKDTAVDAGESVAATAKHEAANVASEAKHQAKELFSSMTSEVESQAGAQQHRIAAVLSSLAKELDGMAAASDQSGPLTDLAKQASRKGDDIAQWLETNEPRDVLSQVTAFGRRRPTMFLGICFLAGVAAGRFTRAAAATNASADSPTPDSESAGARPALDPRKLADSSPTGSAATVEPVTGDQSPAGMPSGNPPASAWGEPATGRSGVDQ